MDISFSDNRVDFPQNIPLSGNQLTESLLHIPIYPYISLYIPIYPYISLYIPIYSYIFLYIPIYPYIFLYIPIYSYISLYIPIYPYISLYICISETHWSVKHHNRWTWSAGTIPLTAALIHNQKSVRRHPKQTLHCRGREIGILPIQSNQGHLTH